MAVVGAWTLALYPSLPAQLREAVPVSAFNLPHLWAFDHAARMLVGERPWSLQTDVVGFPGPVEARIIAWAPILMTVPLRPLLGPVGAYNLVLLLAPMFAALAAWAWLRRLVGPGVAAVAGALPFATSPYLLGCLAAGQICKAQIWLLPAALYVQQRSWETAAEGAPAGAAARWGGRLLAVAGLGGLGALSAFTEPTYALFLPFLLGPAWLARVAFGPRPAVGGGGEGATGGGAAGAAGGGGAGAAGGGGAGAAGGRGRVRPVLDRLESLLVGLAGLGAAAAGMYPAKAYYGGAATSAVSQAFHPADRPSPADLVNAVASWEPTILGRVVVPADPQQTVHLTFLAAPLLLGLAWGLLGGRSSGWLGAVLAVTGGVLAMGEQLVHHMQIVKEGGAVVHLPAAWLAAGGYPLAKSAHYYRAITITTLGLGLALAAAGAGRRGGAGSAGGPAAGGTADGARGTLARLAPWLALGLALAGAAQGLWVTRGLWPRPVAPIPGAAAAAAIAASGREGAVLDLPWAVTNNDWQQYLGATVIHGHPTNALPRALRPQEIPVLRQLDLDLRAALASEDPVAGVRALGFRWVVAHRAPDEARAGLDRLYRALGPGQRDGTVQWWDLGP